MSLLQGKKNNKAVCIFNFSASPGGLKAYFATSAKLETRIFAQMGLDSFPCLLTVLASVTRASVQSFGPAVKQSVAAVSH